MKNTIIKFLVPLSAAIIFVSCSKSEEGAPNKSIQVKNDSEGYFKGIINLEEKDLLGTQSYITYTFNGNEVKREVTEKLSKNESLGMIYKINQDSVVYYYTKDGKSWHTLIPKKEFQNWVTDRTSPMMGEVSASQWRRPFGDIFEFFNSSAPNVSSKIVNSALENCTSVRCQTFLIPQNGVNSCNVWYSEDIKIRPEILGAIEHNQPKSINTLALQVEYFSPKVSAKSTLDKVLDKVDKVLVKTHSKLHFNSIESSDKVSVDLPKNSEWVSAKDLDLIISPKVESSGSGGGGGHHHDFF